MHLNIKNDEAHRLATELADLKGETLTAVVTEALRAELSREQRRRDAGRIAERLMEIGRRFASAPAGDFADRTSDEIIGYDEVGAPK
jgi:antitoxin VapB